jgi:hypothetical protein
LWMARDARAVGQAWGASAGILLGLLLLLLLLLTRKGGGARGGAGEDLGDLEEGVGGGVGSTGVDGVYLL